MGNFSDHTLIVPYGADNWYTSTLPPGICELELLQFLLTSLPILPVLASTARWDAPTTVRDTAVSLSHCFTTALQDQPSQWNDKAQMKGTTSKNVLFPLGSYFFLITKKKQTAHKECFVLTGQTSEDLSVTLRCLTDAYWTIFSCFLTLTPFHRVKVHRTRALVTFLFSFGTLLLLSFS